MDYNIILTRTAEIELDDIVIYISNHLENRQAATDFLNKIEVCYARLTDNPFIYKECEDINLKNNGCRKAVINNYIMIYRVDEIYKKVYIMHFFYDRRDYFNLI